MFKKSKRPIRQRARQSDSDEDNNNKHADHEQETAPEYNQNAANSAKVSNVVTEITEKELINLENSNDSNSISIQLQQSDSAKKSSKLTFHDDDEEEDVFVVKKTVYSRRMERNKKKMLKNVDSIPDANGHSTKKDITTQMKEIELERPKVENNNAKNDEEIICPGSDEEDLDEEPAFEARRNVPQFRNVVERGVIPDAKVIYELKKQRQKLARTLNEDIIPLADGEEEEAFKDSNTKSRLLREEDDDKSDEAEDEDDEKDRIQFGKVDYKTKEREKAKEIFRIAQEEKEIIEINNESKPRQLSDDEYSDDEQPESDKSEDEIDRWEREQIRKAVRLPSLYTYNESEFQNRFLNDTKGTTSVRSQMGRDDHSVVPIEVDDSQARFGSHIPSYISNNSARAQNENNYNTIDEKKADYRKKLKSSLEDHTQLSDRISMDLRITSQNINDYQTRQESFAEDAKFYNETLDFVRSLCDCINDKLESIDKCEQAAFELFQSRCAAQSELSRKTIQDQNAMCLQLIIHHKANCVQYQSYNGNSVFDFYDLAGETDRRDRIVRREERYRKYSLQQVVDGVSSDEEDDSNYSGTTYYSQINDIRQQAEQIFEDTSDEYASLKGVIAQFETWKQTRLDSYAESFVGQFIPKFVVYFVRHETLLWNLFDASNDLPSDAMEMSCIRHLILYGALKETSDSKTEAKSREADIDIVPTILDKTILPRLCTLVEKQIWKPLSTRQTTRLVHFLTSLLSACPSLVDSSERLPLLLKLIVQRVEDFIEKDVFIPQVIPADFFTKSATRTHYESLVITYVTNFFHRQFWQVVKLMRNIVAFRHVILDQVLKELVLDKLLSRVLIMSILRCSADSDAVLTQISRLVSIIPEDWCRGTHPVLLKFADLIQQLSESANRPEDTKRALLALKQRIVQ